MCVFPQSEASNFSEAIPLVHKNPDMIKYEPSVGNFELLSVIGRGFNGGAIVSLTKHIPSGHRLAIKRTNLDSSVVDVTQVQHEVLVTRQLRHENIIPYFCTFVRGCEIWAVMPVMTYGSVRDVLNTHFPTGLPEYAVSFILRDLLYALDYIHVRGYIHRSIKASHLLLSSKGRVMLSGFRYCCNVILNGRWRSKTHAFPEDTVTNLNWLSPEFLEQNLMGYNSRSDIYSMGITAFELANGVAPFTGMAPTQMLLAKLQGYVPKQPSSSIVCDSLRTSSQDMCKASGESSSKTNLFGNDFSSFTTLCLQRDPMQRPSAHQLSSHSFIKLCRKSTASLPEIIATVTPRPCISLDELEGEANCDKTDDIVWSF